MTTWLWVGVGLLGFACSSQHPAPQKAAAPVASSSVPEKKGMPEQPSTAGGPMITCEKGKDQRTLELRTGPAGCSLQYTKLGKTSELATGRAKSAHCAEVQARVREHLAAAGYQCK